MSAFLLASVSENLGTSEAALRLLISLFLGYPLGFIHRWLLYGKSAFLQHVFFITTGLGICYFNFGWHVVHSLANILLIYLLLVVLGGTVASLILAFVINMTYLSVGYYITMSESYTIKWTTPHCVLTLRLIAVVFDVYDGKRSSATLNQDEKESCLSRVPSLLEIAGQTYFFGGFLTGPQFSMRRYLDFVNGGFTDSVLKGKPASVTPACLRLLMGIVYMAIYQISDHYVPESYMLSNGFQDISFLSRVAFVVVWSKLMLYKYVACWLIAEGSCILTGISYNGRDENGNHLWDGCANICISRYEMAASGQELVTSFNMNTNKWMAKYVFKRLRFLGNKNLSQLATLFFLALWHGLYSGYFMNFFLEFLVLNFEKQSSDLSRETGVFARITNVTGIQWAIFLLRKFTIHYALGYALIAFCMFTYDRWMHVYSALYFSGHIFYGVWLIVHPLLLNLLRSQRRKTRETQNGKVD